MIHVLLLAIAFYENMNEVTRNAKNNLFIHIHVC